MTVADFIVEVAESFRTGRRRFILASITTLFSVFLLVLLVGTGLSMTRGIETNYKSIEEMHLLISAGTTSMPYKNHGADVPILIKENDIIKLQNKYPDKINYITYLLQKVSSVTINGKTIHMTCYGVPSNLPEWDFFFIYTHIGSRINSRDIVSKAKVCLISDVMAKHYFRISNPEFALSRYIEIDGVPFKIKGIFEGARADVNINYILLPSTTVATLWNMKDSFTAIQLNCNTNSKELCTAEGSTKFINDVYKLIAHEHSFDYHDKRALTLKDTFSGYRQAKSMLGGMRMTILLLCILILISGIFGVSNILFISVRERTYEIALRRLMGATDANIFALIVCESVVVMLVSSLLGIFLAEGVLQMLDSAVTNLGEGDRGIWDSFAIELPMLISIVLSTLVSGIIAGLAPARRAVRLKITEVH